MQVQSIARLPLINCVMQQQAAADDSIEATVLQNQWPAGAGTECLHFLAGLGSGGTADLLVVICVYMRLVFSLFKICGHVHV